MASAAPPRTRLAREDRMEQTLTVARCSSPSDGFGAVTMDDGRRPRSGVTKPLLYDVLRQQGAPVHRLHGARGRRACSSRGGRRPRQRTSGPRPRRCAAGVRVLLRLRRGRPRRLAECCSTRRCHAGGEIAVRVGEYRGRLVGARRGIAARPAADPPVGARRGGAGRGRGACRTAVLGACEALARWWLRTGAISSSAAADLLIATVEPGLRSLGEHPDTAGIPAGART